MVQKGKRFTYRAAVVSRKKPAGARASARPLLTVRELAQRHSLKAVKKLVELVQSGNERVALSAAQTVLDRAHGKVTQAMSLQDSEAGLMVKIVQFDQENVDE